MKPLIDRIREASQFTEGILHKDFRVETAEGYFVEPSLHYQFIQGAKHQHVQMQWMREALEVAMEHLQLISIPSENTENFLAHSALQIIAALVPKG